MILDTACSSFFLLWRTRAGSSSSHSVVRLPSLLFPATHKLHSSPPQPNQNQSDPVQFTETQAETKRAKLTLGDPLHLVVKTLCPLFQEAISLGAQLKYVGSLDCFSDEGLEGRRDYGGRGLVLVEDGRGDWGLRQRER